MFGWILGGAAALGLTWLGYKTYQAGSGDTVTGLLNFAPFAVKQGQSYVFRVLAPSGLEAFVMKMFKDDVAAAQITPVVVQKNLVISGPNGPKNVDVYEHRVIWKAPDAKFTPLDGVKKLGLTPPAGTSPARALQAALYAAASAAPGAEARLRFFPIGATLNAAASSAGTRLAGWRRRGVG